MTKLLKRLWWVFLAFLLIVFSVENRQTVVLNIPYANTMVDIPLYFLFFLGLFVGVLLATAAVSWSRLKSFVNRRRAEREAVHLKTRLKLQQEQETTDQASERFKAVAEAAKE